MPMVHKLLKGENRLDQRVWFGRSGGLGECNKDFS